MINIKKGPAHSLLQTDITAPINSSYSIVAGQVAHVSTSDGTITPGGATTDLFGFAINSQFSGDVIESGKISLYLLDGASIVETDQVTQAITSSNFPIGTPVYPDSANNGKVSSDDTTDRILGWVSGIRQLPALETISGTVVQGSTALLAIKLNA